jgi:hypothetical protein
MLMLIALLILVTVDFKICSNQQRFSIVILQDPILDNYNYSRFGRNCK